MISKVESTAEKDRVTRDEMILVVATIMKAMMGLKTKNGRLSTSVNTEFGAGLGIESCCYLIDIQGLFLVW